ncbi:MAG: replication-associated recombination protein A [bacterium]
MTKLQNNTVGLFELNTKTSKNNATPSFNTPLAWQLKPKHLDDYIGQPHLLGPNQPLRKLIENDTLPSLILWGPPGCGKTALAQCIATHSQAQFITLNAVMAKIIDIKNAIEQSHLQNKTILFIDEIHRFSKTQQDALLPSVENGQIILIGATTENPYFHVISGLCSRCQIFELHRHSEKDLALILENALKKCTASSNNKHRHKTYTEPAKTGIIQHAKGDARKLINILEICNQLPTTSITETTISDISQDQGLAINQDSHYDLASALIKSMRGSDANASVYWLARLLKGGEDPRFIARRLVIFASEDVGLADAQALPLATAAYQAAQTIGMPEVRINLSHVVCYLAQAPKSNKSYMAINQAMAHIDDGHIYSIPDHLRDAHYPAAKSLGFGKNYIYPHSHSEAAKHQHYLPKEAETFCCFKNDGPQLSQ